MSEPPQRPESQERLVAFGRWVRLLRVSQDLSQEQLGERAGIERAVISRIEQGKVNTGIATLWQLADALGVQVRDLFPDDDHPVLPRR
jgi:transcriptional regulator with XRE-family HTH domain